MQTYPKSVLALHAHPDDTEAFCAGTLALLKDAGFRITIASITGGGLGSMTRDAFETVRLRNREAARAAEVLGAEYFCLGAEDSYVFDSKELRISVSSLIRKIQAGIVLTHLPDDYHADHRATASICEAAAMVSVLPNVPCREKPLKQTPLLYHTAPLGFCDRLGYPVRKPHFFVDISPAMERKMEMLAHHQSQIELMQEMQGIENFFEEMKLYNQELGKLAECSYAEVFWQHLGAGFSREPLIQESLKEYIRDVPENFPNTDKENSGTP